MSFEQQKSWFITEIRTIRRKLFETSGISKAKRYTSDLKYANINEIISTEENSSSETYSRSGNQGITHILWNLKIYCSVYKSPLLIPLLTQWTILHAITSYSFKSHLSLGLRRDVFPSGLLAKFYFSHSCYMPHQSHSIWFVYRKEYELQSSPS